MYISLSKDIDAIYKWSEEELEDFNADETQFYILTNKKSVVFSNITIDGKTLKRSSRFSLVGFTKSKLACTYLELRDSQNLNFFIHSTVYLKDCKTV